MDGFQLLYDPSCIEVAKVVDTIQHFCCHEAQNVETLVQNFKRAAKSPPDLDLSDKVDLTKDRIEKTIHVYSRSVVSYLES